MRMFAMKCVCRVSGKGVTQLPDTAFAFPEMGRAKVIRKAQKVIPIHHRLLEHRARHRKLLLGKAQILVQLRCKSLRKFMVKPLDQRHALFARDVA